MSSAPRHIAVIMDGNGRWAKAHGKPRLAGHRAGADALDRVMHYCREAGVAFLTVYAFSTENWRRSAEEVGGLMKLLATFIKGKERELVANRIRFRVIGRRSDLSDKLQREIAALEEKTAGGDFTLVVALSYGGRDEIVRAAARLLEDRIDGIRKDLQDSSPAERVAQPLLARFCESCQNPVNSVSESDFAACLDTADIPDPDLIIRTSGELRLSNFLLWQAAYAEFYFTDTLWPDFDRAAFDKALASFSRRERRMGGRAG